MFHSAHDRRVDDIGTQPAIRHPKRRRHIRPRHNGPTSRGEHTVWVGVPTRPLGRHDPLRSSYVTPGHLNLNRVVSYRGQHIGTA